MIRLVINGAQGRMGRRIAALAAQDARLQVVAEIDVGGTVRGEDVLANGVVDAVIDVSSDRGARAALSLAQKHRAALLIATTALSEETLQLIDTASTRIAILVAPNLSAGVAIFKRLAAAAARLLGPQFDITIVEHHHAQKLDAPSGTAIALADAVARAGRRVIPPHRIVSGRGGDVVGEHTIRFAGPGEYLELAHVATTRDLFAQSALRAIHWLVAQTPGRYTIEDILGKDDVDRETGGPVDA